jgi:hypothetical protein
MKTLKTGLTHLSLPKVSIPYNVNMSYLFNSCHSDLQCDKRNPGQVCAICDKAEMLKHFDDIAKACPTAKAHLKTTYGLPDNPSPLVKLHLDVYQ